MGFLITSSTALLTSIAILITNENISKLKIRYTKFKVWINVITVLNEKTSKQPMTHKKTDKKEADKLKNICNLFLAKITEIMTIMQCRAENFAGVVIGKVNITRKNF